MNFRQFAFKNVFRNKRLYAGYFFSSAFSVMIFFVYSMLAFHPALSFSDQGSYGKGAQVSMDVSQYIIYVFTFFFILYSMSVFLKSRKKEFGICIMQGMSDFQLRRLVFLENVIIGLAATITGIAAGLLFSKGMLMLGTEVLALEQPLTFYFPVKAATLTFVAFVLLFFFISLFTAIILRSSALIDLLKGSTKPKPEPKASPILAWLAALLIALGYVTAFIVEGPLVLFALLPVVIVVSIGTYFLFTQLSVYVIHKLKKRTKLYRSNTNMITLADLSYRMKDNARMFFLVAMVSTVAFSAIGTLVGMKSMITENVSSFSPPFKYESYSDNKQQEAHTKLIEQTLQKAGIAYTPVVVAKKPNQDQNRHRYTFIAVSSYNAFMGEQLTVGDNEAIVYNPDNKGFDNRKLPKTGEEIILPEGLKFLIKDSAQMPSRFQQVEFSQVAIVSDQTFQALPASKASSTSFIYDVSNWESTLAAGTELNKQLDNRSSTHSFFARAYDLNNANQTFGQILLTGLFIGAVFFVAAGSFLYFRLYADLDQDRVQYRAITKLGLTEKELAKIVSTQIGLLFFVPILVAVIHGAVALNTLHNTFKINLLAESALVLGSFFIIQVIYFLFIRANYVRKLKAVL
ncbi:FtsX-like permease family protein [Paenibacillus sp. GCM10027626]|uniref:FtsX-like permease family protein n=1 Tax=Paenibacillus sp. GCM10027626 TaxID=3273411 RepID=UPI00363D20DA